jgi:hypothetical protein
MALTKTVHPPAGATALLAVVDEVAAGLGWLLVPLVLIGCSIMLVTALLVNNIQRCFPLYWWTPEALGRQRQDSMATIVEENDTGDLEKQRQSSGASTEGPSVITHHDTMRIIIRRGVVTVPPHIFLSPEEKLSLESISNRL